MKKKLFAKITPSTDSTTSGGEDNLRELLRTPHRTVDSDSEGLLPRRDATSSVDTRKAGGWHMLGGRPRKLSIISSSLFSSWWPDRSSHEVQSEFSGKFSELIFRKIYHLCENNNAKIAFNSYFLIKSKLFGMFSFYRENNSHNLFQYLRVVKYDSAWGSLPRKS